MVQREPRGGPCRAWPGGSGVHSSFPTPLVWERATVPPRLAAASWSSCLCLCKAGRRCV